MENRFFVKRDMMRRKIQNKRGFTLVELMIAVGIVILLVALSIKGLMRSRMIANETAAIETLQTLHSVFSSYRFANPAYPTDLNDLVLDDPPYIDAALASGTRQGYEFSVASFDSVDSDTFTLRAIPSNPGITGSREFYVMVSGEIYDQDGIILGGGEVVGTCEGGNPCQGIGCVPTPPDD